MKIYNLFTFNSFDYAVDYNFPKTINPQLYFIDSKEGLFAYSPIFNSFAKISQEEKSFLLSHPKLINDSDVSDHKELSNAFFYFNDQTLNALSSEGERITIPEYGKSQINGISLIMTALCNLRCKYCFVFGGEPDKIQENRKIEKLHYVLDPEIALSAIDYFKPKETILGKARLQIDRFTGDIKGYQLLTYLPVSYQDVGMLENVSMVK